ncbi:unnamed protein product [Prunus brigantina]
MNQGNTTAVVPRMWTDIGSLGLLCRCLLMGHPQSKCFGILQARWAIITGAARILDEEVIRSIMMTCIILHNMIMEDKYDYDAPEVFKPNPMNTTLTRIYERLMGPNRQPMEHEPLIRDGRYNNPMIDHYQEMQSSYVHERRQVDLIEHLWEMKGNHSG